jgi:hypothetical protein
MSSLANSDTWAMNVVSIGEGKSYFLAEDPEIQAELAKLLAITFQGNLATGNRLWLRKEVVKASLASVPLEKNL